MRWAKYVSESNAKRMRRRVIEARDSHSLWQVPPGSHWMQIGTQPNCGMNERPLEVSKDTWRLQESARNSQMIRMQPCEFEQVVSEIIVTCPNLLRAKSDRCATLKPAKVSLIPV